MKLQQCVWLGCWTTSTSCIVSQSMLHVHFSRGAVSPGLQASAETVVGKLQPPCSSSNVGCAARYQCIDQQGARLSARHRQNGLWITVSFAVWFARCTPAERNKPMCSCNGADHGGLQHRYDCMCNVAWRTAVTTHLQLTCLAAASLLATLPGMLLHCDCSYLLQSLRVAHTERGVHSAHEMFDSIQVALLFGYGDSTCSSMAACKPPARRHDEHKNTSYESKSGIVLPQPG
jgi:hypothetical protein